MNDKFVLAKKKYSGSTSVVSLRMPDELLNKIDQVCEITGRTRNEIIIKSLDFAIENLEIKEIGGKNNG